MTASKSNAAAESEIRALIDARTKAIRARDVDGSTAALAPDISWFDVVNPLRHAGADTVRERATAWFASFDGAGGCEIRALSVAATYLRLGVLNEMQYRANFFVAVFQSLLSVGVGLAVLALVYSHTATLNGWTRSELLVILGVQILLGGVVHMSTRPNRERLV